MIEMVRRRHLNVTVGSNGLMLNAEMARDLVRLGVGSPGHLGGRRQA